MNVAIIPARGGSKRIPGKNIKTFRGRPIISYPIKAALESGVFEHVVVSTDEREIAEVARKEGAEVPFLRPQDLSGDHASTIPVIAHAINAIEELWGNIKSVCVILATAPFVRAEDLAGSHALFQKTESVDFLISVVEFSYPVQRGFYLNGENRMEMLFPEHRTTRSQDLRKVYHDAAHFFWGTRAAFLENRDDLSERCVAWKIPSWRVQDIDVPDDWQRAELLHEAVEKWEGRQVR